MRKCNVIVLVVNAGSVSSWTFYICTLMSFPPICTTFLIHFNILIWNSIRRRDQDHKY